MSELPQGHRIGGYEIRSLLGRGGMGEVYRAHDARLRRDVAIKILPSALADNADRLSRFEREARALAALNHPNIAAIYGIEERALILELVEGETLSERLQRGAVPPSEAIAIARQIAEGLEAAHEAGIVHRDLKPANIQITPAGLVKLLDFGIAKVSAEHDDATRTGTELGSVIGTAAYMSPEQARGQQVDKRSDIWSFGCVLFDLLTGRHAFARATPTDTLAAILEHDPDWSLVPASTPAPIVALLRRCLIKDSRNRLRDIGEARVAFTTEAASPPVAAVGRRRPPVAVVSIALLIAAAVAAGFFLRPRATAPAAMISFPINPPPTMAFGPDVPRIFFDLSRDGTRLAFEAGNATTGLLWLQTVGELEARQLKGTEGGGGAEFSPDGESLAFFAEDELRRIDLKSGAVTVLTSVPDSGRLAASWGSAGSIVYGSAESGAIWTIPESGGTPEVVIKREEDQARVHFPMFLPDGRRFLYVIRKKDGATRLGIAAKGTPGREIGAIESNMGWIEPDILVSAHAGGLIGQRFDLDAERLVGEPFAVTDQVDHFPTTSRALFSTSVTGTITTHLGIDQSQLTWFDRSGRIVGTVGDVNGHSSARISPDGTRLLFDKSGPRGRSWDLWIADLARDVETRVTSDPGVEVTAVWLKDGHGIVYGSDRNGVSPQLYRRDLDTGVDVQLSTSPRQQQSYDVSPDGKTLSYVERGPAGNFEMFTMPLDRPAEAAQFGPPTRFFNSALWFSPDNRAVAFSSNRGGRFDVYVAMRATPTAIITVSRGGGGVPRWSRDGKELYYLTGDRKLMAVPIRTSPSLVVGDAAPLFELSTGQWLDYDPSPDGRFLAVLMKQPAAAQPIRTIVNWRPPADR